MSEDDSAHRRQLLRTLGASSIFLSAGCNTSQNSSPETPTSTDTSTSEIPTSADTSTSETADPSSTAIPETQTLTPKDKQPPVIEQFKVNPQQTGTILDVSITVRDNQELESSEIKFRDKIIRTELSGKKSNLEKQITGVAKNGSSETSQVQYRVRDVAGNETTRSVTPDTTAPSLSIVPRTSDAAGAVELAIEGDDDVGLSELQIFVGDTRLDQRSVIGQRAITIETTVSPETTSAVNIGHQNRVTVSLTDTLGNSIQKSIKQYIRKYDKMENPRVNLGGLYISQAGDALTNNLSDDVDTEPAVGIYNSPIPPQITSRHIDQMTGFGFTHVVYDYGDQRPWAEAFLQSDLANQVDIMPTYIMPIFERNMDKSWKTDVLPRTLSFLKENFLSRDNAVTIDGRPVLDTWNWRVLAAHDEKRNKLLDEFGSFQAFSEFVREEARTERGEPYILFGIAGAGRNLFRDDYESLQKLAQQFDGLRTWFHGSQGGWDDVIERATVDFEACQSFAENHDMDFTPIARPGYDERWDTGEYRKTNRYLPRDPDRFRQLLQLADQYRTSDRAFVCYNDWIEGHTIEPGTFTGTEFGTEYLEIVKQFQQPDK